MGAAHPPAGHSATLTLVTGLLLAAGAGSRMGVPKALLRDDDGVPYLDRTIGALFEGGCADVMVVLGAAAEDAMEILRVHGWTECEDLTVLVNDDWPAGMGSSLKAGLGGLDSEAALVMLVDLPDVRHDVVRRLLEDAAPAALTRATYDGKPGHPVLIGRNHWQGVLATTEGDRGAQGYLDSHDVREVPCDDLASGRDLDRPEDLPRSLDR